MAKPKIENLAETSVTDTATLGDRTEAFFQYIKARTDAFAPNGPTDSYKYILAEVVQNRLRQQQTSYPNSRRQ